MHKSLRTDPGTLLELRVCHSSRMKTRAWSWVCVKSWESTWPTSEAQFCPIPWPALFPDLKQVTWSLWVSFFSPQMWKCKCQFLTLVALWGKGQDYIWWYTINMVSGTWLILSISICGKSNPFGLKSMFPLTSKYKHVELLSFFQLNFLIYLREPNLES